jgi:translocation and assembly module TamA
VNESFVRRRLLLHEGERYDPAEIEAARRDLAGLGVFSSVTVRPGDALDSAGRLPLDFDVTERPKYAVNLGVGFSTDQGGYANASWTDRNVFGNAEQLTFSATVSNLGGTAVVSPGYDVFGQFIKPDFLARDQSWQTKVEALHANLQAYDQTAFIVSTGLTRKLTQQLTVSGGLSFEQEEILQEGVNRHYTLLGVPLAVKWDSTDNLLNPTKGFRATASVTPTQELQGHGGTFVIAQLSGSTYLDAARFGWADPGRSVLAMRGLLGSITGASQFDIPADQRFYAGGSGTVRGFRYQSIGPQFPDGNPEGGTSVYAGSMEFRQRFGENYGAVAFVDLGSVGTDTNPFSGTPRVGAGVGARYYTVVGPIRLDVAIPLNKQPGGDSFELYLGIGQSF